MRSIDFWCEENRGEGWRAGGARGVGRRPPIGGLDGGVVGEDPRALGPLVLDEEDDRESEVEDDRQREPERRHRHRERGARPRRRRHVAEEVVAVDPQREPEVGGADQVEEGDRAREHQADHHELAGELHAEREVQVAADDVQPVHRHLCVRELRQDSLGEPLVDVPLREPLRAAAERQLRAEQHRHDVDREARKVEQEVHRDEVAEHVVDDELAAELVPLTLERLHRAAVRGGVDIGHVPVRHVHTRAARLLLARAVLDDGEEEEGGEHGVEHLSRGIWV